MNETFISYSRRDIEFVARLDAALRKEKFDPWIDIQDIPPAVKWEEEMLLGVQFCDNFVFVLSPDSIKSNPCNKELNCALRHNKRLVPILYRPCIGLEIHKALSELNWILFHQFERGLEQLIQVLTLPREQMGSLTDRTQAYVTIHRHDGSVSPPFPLYRSCYWVGREPVPPAEEAGAIVVRDPSRYVSRLHLQLKVLNQRWYAINRSRNGFFLQPHAPDGRLEHNARIILGSGIVLNFQEVRQEEPEELDPRDTFY